MTTASSLTVLWLLPTEPARSFLEGTIARLALAQDAPRFTPHLTLGLGEAKQLEEIDFNPAPLTLPLRGLACSEQFTKTLFLRFEQTPALRALRAAFALAAADFDPHLSLLYKKMPLLALRQLLSDLSIPFAEVEFSAIAAIRCPAHTTSRADVESWEIIAQRELA